MTLDLIGHDVRFAWRALARQPALALIAVGSLGAAMAAAIAVFGLANAVLFDRLPVPDPDRLVVLRWVAGGARRSSLSMAGAPATTGKARRRRSRTRVSSPPATRRAAARKCSALPISIRFTWAPAPSRRRSRQGRSYRAITTACSACAPPPAGSLRLRTIGPTPSRSPSSVTRSGWRASAPAATSPASSCASTASRRRSSASLLAVSTALDRWGRRPTSRCLWRCAIVSFVSPATSGRRPILAGGG